VPPYASIKVNIWDEATDLTGLRTQWCYFMLIAAHGMRSIGSSIYNSTQEIIILNAAISNRLALRRPTCFILLRNEMTSPVAGKTAPRLFISYSHDSREHEDRVRALADRLREYGVDAVVDQYDTAPPDGWPVWMAREIQKADFVALVCTETYLRRVEGRESPYKGRGVLWEAKLIYSYLYDEDTSFQRFIPILLDGGNPSCIPRPLRSLTRYALNSEQDYEEFYRHLTGQPRHEKPAIGRLKSLPAMSLQSYPGSLETPSARKSTSLDQRNRRQTLKRVRLDWIDGVLKQSLYHVARIEFGLQTKADAIERPLRAVVQAPDQPPTAVPTSTTISQVFDDYGSALLILGAPGTGKTTLLLELAEQLLDRAEQDENHPMPIVFNLSSWAVRRPPLERWLIAELNESSDVPKRLAQHWVESDQILPLLDGLDEVAAEQRQACAEAINDFRRDHGLLPIAICSRTADYEALGRNLRLRNAIVVQPLTRPEVEEYLERVGEPLRPLREALEKDPPFWELLVTPLMLWVAMLAHRDAPVTFAVASTFEQRRRRLFASFVDAMFKRRSAEVRYTPSQTVRWLSWLASALRRKEQTVFYLENLSEEWLPTRSQRWFSRVGFVVSAGVIGGMVAGVIGWLIDELMFEGLIYFGILIGSEGLIFGLSIGLVASFMDLQPSESIRISLVSLSFRLRSAARIGLIGALGLWLIFVGLGVALGSASDLLIFGLIFGLLVGLMFGIVTLLIGDAVETRRKPNEGTFRSIKIGLAAGLIVGLIVGSIVGMIATNFEGQNPVRYQALIVGSIAGVIAGLVCGGLFSIKHLVLRLMFWNNRSAPLHYVRFLDCAVERLFLRKVGGGYVFSHRMLMDYFASLSEQPSFDQDTVKSTTPGPV